MKIRVTHDGRYLLRKDTKLKDIEKLTNIEGPKIFGISSIRTWDFAIKSLTQPKAHGSRHIHSFYFSTGSSKLALITSGSLSDLFFFF